MFDAPRKRGNFTVCDVAPERLVVPAAQPDVRAYRHVSEMLEAEVLDFVIVATPHDQHEEAVREASKRGVHVLKEKPFARSLREAWEFKHMCDTAGIELMTILPRRFNPAYCSFPRYVERIGQPFFFEARYTLYTHEPHVGWRGSRETSGGGCLIDMGYHMIDLLIWYFGLPAGILAQTSAAAIAGTAYDAEDTALLTLRYRTGLYGSVLISRYLPPKTESIRVLGPAGRVEVDRFEVRHFDRSGELVETFVPGLPALDPGAAQIEAFCDVLAGARPNPSSPAAHLDHLRFVEASYRSQQEARYVDPATVELS